MKQNHTSNTIPPIKNGRIKTLNNTGWMNTEIDKVTQAFIDFATEQSLPVLDIGAAYGIATKKLLENGVSVIANDIEPKHLELIATSCTKEQRERLTLKPAAFPEMLSIDCEVGAILASRVLHFLNGEQLVRAANKIFKLLSKGGRVYVIADSPYLKAWSKYIPIYEAKKNAGYQFPGLVDEPDAINAERAQHVPKTLHRLDPDVLTRVFTEAGFNIIECDFFAMTIYPDEVKYDGRECVALVAQRP